MNILIVEDKPEFGGYLKMLLEEDLGHQVTHVLNGQEALKFQDEKLVDFEIAFVDMMMPGLDGFETGVQLKDRVPHIVTIMLTGYPSIKTVIKALRDCKFDDYLQKTELSDSKAPRSLNEVLIKAQGLLGSRKAHSNEYQLSKTSRPQAVEIHRELIGQSSAFQPQMIENVALTDSIVLITGETGTGKELVAREIHQRSHRRLKPFVPINCSAIPAGLLESELFGYKKGAFTGAFGNKTGFLQLADGGTLFLDEIGDMPFALQARLLRVLQDQQFFPVGSSNLLDVVKVDVRILSATNQDLGQKIKDGSFRKDLFYRLNTVTIALPPLRERISDLNILVQYFIAQKSKSKQVKGIFPDALEILRQWPWEGNIRELEHIIERAIIVSTGEYLSCHDLPKEMQEHTSLRPPDLQKDSALFSDSAIIRQPGEFPQKSSLQAGPIPPGSSQDYERLWEKFAAHGFQLWKIENDRFVNQQLKTTLKNARYLKKGHSGRLIVAENAELEVNLQYISAHSFELEKMKIFFQFKTEQSFDQLDTLHQTRGNTNFVSQPVLRGLPDTYLFNILYPPAKPNEMLPIFPQQLIRAAILRYAQTQTPSKSLKFVFQQIMTFLIDQEMAQSVDGLTKDGLEATRAYLTGESHIFAGIARKLKSEPHFIEAEIQKVFPGYSIGDRGG